MKTGMMLDLSAIWCCRARSSLDSKEFGSSSHSDYTKVCFFFFLFFLKILFQDFQLQMEILLLQLIGLLIHAGSEPQQIVRTELTCLTLTKAAGIFYVLPSMIHKSHTPPPFFPLSKCLLLIAEQTLSTQVTICNDSGI